MIINDDYDPVPETTAPNIRMLIMALLQKDQGKRPSVWELANNKVIREKLDKFVEENDCKELVESLVSFDKKNKQNHALITMKAYL